jgi:hypothetical protein
MELINGTLEQLHALTAPAELPNLALIRVRQRARGLDEQPLDHDLARIYAGLMLLPQLGCGAVSKPVVAPRVSIREGSWRFSSPAATEEGVQCMNSAEPFNFSLPANFEFALLRCI